jgi:hypothetical protein
MSAEPLQFLLMMLAGWLNRQQLEIIDYLKEKNRVLREELGGRRVRFTDDQRRRLAMKGRAHGRRALDRVAGLVTPDTYLAHSGLRRPRPRRDRYDRPRPQRGARIMLCAGVGVGVGVGVGLGFEVELGFGVQTKGGHVRAAVLSRALNPIDRGVQNVTPTASRAAVRVYPPSESSTRPNTCSRTRSAMLPRSSATWSSAPIISSVCAASASNCAGGSGSRLGLHPPTGDHQHPPHRLQIALERLRRRTALAWGPTAN